MDEVEKMLKEIEKELKVGFQRLRLANQEYKDLTIEVLNENKLLNRKISRLKERMSYLEIKLEQKNKEDKNKNIVIRGLKVMEKEASKSVEVLINEKLEIIANIEKTDKYQSEGSLVRDCVPECTERVAAFDSIKLQVVMRNLQPSFFEGLILSNIKNLEDPKMTFRIIEQNMPHASTFIQPSAKVSDLLGPELLYQPSNISGLLKQTTKVKLIRNLSCWICVMLGHTYYQCPKYRTIFFLECGIKGVFKTACPRCTKSNF
ncbi:hypothetical protein ILUMI_08473 [Ignelater luminosus]|uniref:Uncharacterized protein n=1 Tax=Ignelater luminosus TaxID=2038154 RepID=A0A8K0D1K7_IGNLU|nr:hypothetical protein ILUMI_08473 [Ignelater luminosus]